MQRAHPPATLTGWMVRVIATRLPSARFARLVVVMVVMVVCVCGRATPCGSCLTSAQESRLIFKGHLPQLPVSPLCSARFRCRLVQSLQTTPRGLSLPLAAAGDTTSPGEWVDGWRDPPTCTVVHTPSGRESRGGAGSGGGQQVAGQEVYGARQVGDRVDQVRVSPYSLYYHNAIVERVPCFSQGQHARTRSG